MVSVGFGSVRGVESEAVAGELGHFWRSVVHEKLSNHTRHRLIDGEDVALQGGQVRKDVRVRQENHLVAIGQIVDFQVVNATAVDEPHMFQR